MPESVTDRPTKAHEYVFLLTRQPRYWFDAEAVREPADSAMEQWRQRNGRLESQGPKAVEGRESENGTAARRGLGHPAGRNIRSVWEIATQPYPEAHFATYPQELVRRALLAGCPEWVCRTCGKPRERIVETGSSSWEARKAVGHKTSGYHASDGAISSFANPDARLAPPGVSTGGLGWVAPHQTLGWSDCGHNNHRPGVVLDPFLGSGTTALVARHHNRHCIGIELSPAYAQLAAQRLQQLSLLAETPA